MRGEHEKELLTSAERRYASIQEAPRRGIFSETRAPGYAASCISIRPMLRVVASPSDESVYLVVSQGTALPGWGALGLLG
jgi:hypothetical protein